jgi:hypothetical protein
MLLRMVCKLGEGIIKGAVNSQGDKRSSGYRKVVGVVFD